MQTAGSRGARLVETATVTVHEWLLRGLSPVDQAQSALVVKEHLGPDGRRRCLAEAAVLTATDHPHIVRALGLVDDGDRLGLLLPRLSTRSAAAWLRRRSTISAGEAVTVLVPLLRAVAHLDHRGFGPATCDGSAVDLVTGIGLDDVLFDPRGAPVLVSLRATPRDTYRAGTVATTAQRLVSDVTRSVDPLSGVGGGLPASMIEGSSLHELIEVLFEWAAPEPLGPVGDDPPIRTRPLVAGGSSAPELRGRPASRRLRSRASAVARSALEVRPRVWITAGVVAASLVGALTLLPAPTGSPPAPSAGDDQRTSPAVGRTLDPVAPTASATSPAIDRILAGDDAARAATELLRLRSACLIALDAECIAGVDQPGSPLLTSDKAAIAEPALLAEVPVRLRRGKSINEFGGSVLFSARDTANDEPAVVLVTRTTAGWRLRSIAPA